MHSLAGYDSRGHHFYSPGLLGINRAFSVQRFAHRRDNPAEYGLTDRHLGNITGALDHITFFDMDVFAHNSDSDIVFLKV